MLKLFVEYVSLVFHVWLPGFEMTVLHACCMYQVINGYLQSRGSLVQCALTESKGRILVASRDFESGEPQLNDGPIA